MEKQDKWTNLMYYVVFGLSHLLSLLPFCILYFLSDGLYLLMYYCIKYRRDVVRDNLLKSFPEKSLDELIRIEKKFYHFFCDYFVETLKLTSISKKEMRKHVPIAPIKRSAVSMAVFRAMRRDSWKIWISRR